MADYASDISFLKFKYGLQNFFATVKMLKEKEASARQDFQILMEKHKKLEAAHSEEVLALRSEITTGNEARCNLEAEVQDLRREASLKCTKIETLKEELKALTDARCQLTEKLKETNYDLECRLEERTHELCVLMEKHSRQSALLEAIEKEAFSVRQVVEETRICIQQKEEEVSSFEKSLMKVIGFEGTFLKKLEGMEQQLKTVSSELTKKNELIMALEKKLEAVDNDPLVEAEQADLKQNLEVKENLISMLRQDKEVLLENLRNQDMIIERFQETIIQQEELVSKYQQEILILHKGSDMLKDRLLKTEQNLQEAIQENRKLAGEMEDQKRGFSVQIHLWEDARTNLEAKIHELEGLAAKNKCLLQRNVAGDQQAVRNECQDKDGSNLMLKLEEKSEITNNITEDALRNDSQNSEINTELEDKTLYSGTQLNHISQHKKNLEGGNSLNIQSILKRLGRPISLIRTNESNDLRQTENIPVEAPKTSSSEQIDQDPFPAQVFNHLEHPVTHANSKAQLALIEHANIRKQFPSTNPDETGSAREGPVHEFDDGQQQDVTHSTVIALPSHIREQLPSTNLDETGSARDGPVPELDDCRQQDMTHSTVIALPNHIPTSILNEVGHKRESSVQKLEEQHSEQSCVESEERQPAELVNVSTSIELIGSQNGREESPTATDAGGQLEEQDESTFKLHLELRESSKVPKSSKVPRMEPHIRFDVCDIEQNNTANENSQREHPAARPKLLVSQHTSGHEVDVYQEPDGKQQPCGRDEVNEHREDDTYPSSQPPVLSLQDQETEHHMSGVGNMKLNHYAMLKKQHDGGGGLQRKESMQSVFQKPEANSGRLSGSEVCSKPTSLYGDDVRNEELPLDISEGELVNGKSEFDARYRCSTLSGTEPKPCKKKASVPPSANECFCNMPPYGYMVICKVCGVRFHAACIHIEEILQDKSYTCTRCKDQPTRKRRQMQHRSGMENSERF